MNKIQLGEILTRFRKYCKSILTIETSSFYFFFFFFHNAIPFISKRTTYTTISHICCYKVIPNGWAPWKALQINDVHLWNSVKQHQTFDTCYILDKTTWPRLKSLSPSLPLNHDSTRKIFLNSQLTKFCVLWS